MEVTEADICERFGWTFDEMDNQDQDRVFASFAMQNIRDVVGRIKNWLDRSGKTHISQRDMEVYGKILDAEKEINNANGSS